MNIHRTLSLVGLCIGAQACFHDPLGGINLATSDATSDASRTTEPATTEPATTSTETTGEPTTGSGSDTTTADASTGAAGSCGDGTVDPDEQCDDGSDNGPGQACKSDCTANICGDGDQAPGEGCDDGNANDGDGCSAACTPESCGDGILQTGEECDDGNATNDDTCTNMCTAPVCGDGITQPGEECDDGNMLDDDACTNMCQKSVKRVFVSSMEFEGDLGGVAGADAKCQQLAQSATLPGTYRAWITDAVEQNAPAVRFTKATVPYVRTDGVIVADDWLDLTDGTLDAPIDHYENGLAFAGEIDVYTNTRPDGSRKGTLHCSNWSTQAAQGGGSGLCSSADTRWTDNTTVSCTGTNRIYCFQQ